MTVFAPRHAQHCSPGVCFCVPPSAEDRQWAIEQLIRPEEVAHLFRVGPVNPFRNESSAHVVARVMGEQGLVYIPDPMDCDRWCSPAETLRRGGGDCDDLAIFAAAAIRLRFDAAVVVGTFHGEGHAWVEGIDERGWFHFEATRGIVFRHWANLRPFGYRAHQLLRPHSRAA